MYTASMSTGGLDDNIIAIETSSCIGLLIKSLSFSFQAHSFQQSDTPRRLFFSKFKDLWGDTFVDAVHQVNIPRLTISHFRLGNALGTGLVQFQWFGTRLATFLPKLGVLIDNFLFRLGQRQNGDMEKRLAGAQQQVVCFQARKPHWRSRLSCPSCRVFRVARVVEHTAS
jgi:hypothetical protein